MPKRIQRKRTKGWRMPEGAVYVGRPSKWGNPYTVAMMQARIDELRAIGIGESFAALGARQLAVEAFGSVLRFGPDSPWWAYGPHMGVIEIKHALQQGELAGKDLACWCPLEDEHGDRVPCHADVLLEIANGEHP